MHDIQDLLDRFEAFKKKGLKLNEQDVFERLNLCDDINDTVVELESRYLEGDATLDKEYGLRLIELKDQKDADGKKKYTDATAKAMCDNEFFDKMLDLIVIKETQKRLQKKADLIVPYTSAVKLYLKKDFSI